MTSRATAAEETAAIAALGPNPMFVADCESRLAERLDIDVVDARAILSRLFAAGRVRLVRREGVMAYEPMLQVE
jgi:hypothetical protein